MRHLLAVLATLVLAQCASHEDNRFRVGSSPRAYVIIGVAESAANTAESYRLLWRRLDENGRFMSLGMGGDANSFEPHTNARSSIRIRGIPGEFEMQEIDPGVYALDSVFAVLRGEHVNYFANGVVQGADRPSFEVGPGEAIYLGIWETNLNEVNAVVRPWRLDPADMIAVMRAARDPIIGAPVLRETKPRDVACTPHRMSNITQRQIC